MSNSTILIKYWFEVSEEEQRKRFLKPIEDPMRQWKLSPMDLESHRRWYDYSRAKDTMLAATDTPQSLMTFRPNGIFLGVHSAVQAFLKVERPAQASAAAL